MGNDLQDDVIHAGETGRNAGGQAGQRLAVPFRQVLSGENDLFLDEIEIVQQPFAAGRDRFTRANVLDQHITDFQQRLLVVVEAFQELIGRVGGLQLMPCGSTWYAAARAAFVAWALA